MQPGVKYSILLLFVLATAYRGSSQALSPTWNVKTNLIYDATATINIAPEFRLGGKTSLEIPVNYNPWQFAEGRQWRHYLVQPEVRLWTRRFSRGSFFGLHGHYAFYNIGNLPEPFSPWMQSHRVQGTAIGAGVSYGYRWRLGRGGRWDMEATVGVGWAHLDYKAYQCDNCQKYEGETKKDWFGPTKVGLYLVYNIGGVEPTPEPVVVPVVPVMPIISKPVLLASFVVPEVEAQKQRTASGAAYLNFEVGKAKIYPDYKDNAAELEGIRQSLNTVRGDESVSITGIEIVGYASPEDSWTSNLTLSAKRAQSLLEWVLAESGLPREIFVSRGEGEDWKGFERLVEESDIEGRDEVLDIIRSRGVTEETERRLAVYKQVPSLYPPLRRVEYRIAYDVAPMTVARGREVLYTRPELLSLNEMFLIAEEMEIGSAEWAEVFEIAARVFPDSDVANLNAAASAIERGDEQTAARHLNMVAHQTPQWHNNMGIVRYMQGDAAGAKEHFEKAGAAGAANDAEMRKTNNY
jgi:outer membrane protein OmpA-like peptidoglycan-associated protein